MRELWLLAQDLSPSDYVFLLPTTTDSGSIRYWLIAGLVWLDKPFAE
jgi:hypothetical protein